MAYIALMRVQCLSSSFIPSQLIVVSDIFEFQDGTVHFAPAVPIPTADRVFLRAGDQLELRRPDGSVIKTTLHGIDCFSPSNGMVGLGLGKPLSKTDIPVGTEIWKVG
jgi:hypothetical protein